MKNLFSNYAQPLTLGEFRALTAHLPDDIVLYRAGQNSTPDDYGANVSTVYIQESKEQVSPGVWQPLPNKLVLK